MGWLTVHTGGLEAAIVRHVVHNCGLLSLQILLFFGLASLDPTLSMADAGHWIVPTAWVTSTVFYAVVIVILTKAFHQWRDHTGPPVWASPGPNSAAKNPPVGGGHGALTR